MKKSIFMRLSAAFIAVSSVISAFSCESSQENMDEDTGGNVLQTIENTDEIVSCSYKSEELNTSLKFSDFSDIWRIDEGNYAFCGINSENGETEFYVSDSSFANPKKIELNTEKPENGEISVIGSASPDGKIYIIVKTTDYGSVKMPDTSDPDFIASDYDYGALYSAARYSYEIITADSTGIISRNPIEDSGIYNSLTGGFLSSGMYFMNVIALNGGKMLVQMSMGNEAGCKYAVLNSDGKFGREINISAEYTDSAFADKDGNAVFLLTDDYISYRLFKFDAETLTKGETLNISYAEDSLGFFGVKILQGADGCDYYICAEDCLYGIKNNGTAEKIAYWANSDIDGGCIKAAVSSDDGSFTVFMSESGTQAAGFYRLTRRDPSEISETVISLGVMYQDTEISRAVTSFNRENGNIHINIVDYSGYSDEEKNIMPEDKFIADMKEGNAPDMIMCSDMNMIKSLSSEGAFADFYDYLGDDSLKKEDILPNIIEACETDGRLTALAPTFSVSTIAAKKKFIGKENLTLDEMTDIYNSLPESMRFLNIGDSAEQVFDTFMTGMNFVDFSDNGCRFNSEDFKKLLKFCTGFSNEKNTADDSDTALHDDKALIGTVYFSSPFDYAHTRYIHFGEDISFVGYPSSDGRGGVLRTNGCFAITENSANKEECWRFIGSFFTEDFYDRNFSSVRGFFSYKPAFEKQLDLSLSKPVKIINGTEQKSEDYDIYNGEIVKINPVSKEERDRFAEYLLSAKPFIGYNDEIYSIIREGAAAFFNEDKNIDETVSLIEEHLLNNNHD